METNKNTSANELGKDETATSETTNTENAAAEAVTTETVIQENVTVLNGVRLFKTISDTFNHELGSRTIVEAMETSQGVLVKTTSYKDILHKKAAEAYDKQKDNLSVEFEMSVTPMVEMMKTLTYQTECTTFIPAVKVVELADGSLTIK